MIGQVYFESENLTIVKKQIQNDANKEVLLFYWVDLSMSVCTVYAVHQEWSVNFFFLMHTGEC